MVKACLVLFKFSRLLGDGDDDGVKFGMVGKRVAIFCSGISMRIWGIILIESCLRWRRLVVVDDARVWSDRSWVLF